MEGVAERRAETAAQGLEQPPRKSDDELREILAGARTIAVVGIKDRAGADAHRIPQYLQSQGFRVIPVNPKLERVLGEAAYASLCDVNEPVDIVNIFRAHENILYCLCFLYAVQSCTLLFGLPD